MNNTKTFKKTNFAPLFVALFIFLRAILLSDRRRVGFAGFYPLEFDFSTIGIVLVCLLLVFAVLSALLMAKLEKKFGKSGLIISAILVAEPLLFVKQENCINLFVWCLALLFILNALREKPIIPNEITLVVFLLVSTILFEKALFLYVFPALVFYFSADIDKLFKSTKKIVMMCLSAVSVCAGMILNDYLIKTYPAFDKFLKEYSFFRQFYFKHIKYEKAWLFIFAIPVLVFGVFFFKGLFEKAKTVSKKVKNNKNDTQVIGSFNPVAPIAAVVISYVFSIIGFTQAGSAAFFTINYIVPLSVIALLNAKNPCAEKSMQKLGVIVEKHSLVFVSVLVALFYLVTRIFLSNVDNLATFMTVI